MDRALSIPSPHYTGARPEIEIPGSRVREERVALACKRLYLAGVIADPVPRADRTPPGTRRHLKKRKGEL